MTIFYVTGTDLSFEPVQIIAHTVPSGLQAVNGSVDHGNCADMNRQSNGLSVCEDPNAIGFSNINPTKSVLVDSVIPTLNVSDDNWAEGFFTVRRNNRTTIELGFELDTNNIITRVEVESLECPDRGIGTSTVSLFGMEDPGGFLFPPFGGTITLLDTVTPEATSCSVQTHTLCIPMGEQPYRYYYLVFTFSNSDIDWLFLAEVRFLVNSSTPTTTTVIPTTTGVTPAPSVTPSTSIALSIPPSPRTSALQSSTTPTTIPESSPSGGSCIDTSVLVVCVTVVVLAAVISIVVHIAICTYQLRQRQRCGQTSNGAPQEAIYEDMEGEEATGLKTKGNEAYGFLPPRGASANNPPQSTAL